LDQIQALIPRALSLPPATRPDGFITEYETDPPHQALNLQRPAKR